ncbi:MAG: electron transfer flavoprotein subunit beta/FixA family protein [Anaerolineales bacterium]|nr:electron transfer flavoprotein subunit beta/FixA family protein [Anaerolineales bacterium]
MNILVCVKRVPATGGKIDLTDDGLEIDTRYLGFTISPHEECAVEEAVRLTEAQGGSSTVLTLGPTIAEEQLRDAMAMGIDNATLLETDGREWDPAQTARAITDAVRAKNFDVVLFGNEAADTGDYQVGVRVAYALDWPCVTGIKSLVIENGTATVKREAAGGWEVFQVPLPAVFTVKEGINLPRYPPLMGRLKAKKKAIERIQPQWSGNALEKIQLKLPPDVGSQVEILGKGPDAALKVVDILRRIGAL